MNKTPISDVGKISIHETYRYKRLSVLVHIFMLKLNKANRLSDYKMNSLLHICKPIHAKMKYEDIALINNEALHNFELTVDGVRAYIDYKQMGNKVYLIHTEVPEEMEGMGIASALVEKTFSYLEQRNLKIMPVCSYILTYLKRHPEWNRLRAYPVENN